MCYLAYAFFIIRYNVLLYNLCKEKSFDVSLKQRVNEFAIFLCSESCQIKRWLRKMICIMKYIILLFIINLGRMYLKNELIIDLFLLLFFKIFILTNIMINIKKIVSYDSVVVNGGNSIYFSVIGGRRIFCMQWWAPSWQKERRSRSSSLQKIGAALPLLHNKESVHSSKKRARSFPKIFNTGYVLRIYIHYF